MVSLKSILLNQNKLRKNAKLLSVTFLAGTLIGCSSEPQNDEIDYNFYYNGNSSESENSYINVKEDQSFTLAHTFTQNYDLYIGTTPAVKSPRERNPNDYVLIKKDIDNKSIGCRIDAGYHEMTCTFSANQEQDSTVDLTNLIKSIPTNLYLFASIETENGEIVTGYQLKFN